MYYSEGKNSIYKDYMKTLIYWCILVKSIYKCSVCGCYTESPVHCGKQAKLILDGSKRLALSKLISFILRHNPSSIGLVMDREGWVKIEDLVYGIKNLWINKHLYSWVTREHIIALAQLDYKGRFEVKNGYIRARYGHSRNLQIEISYPTDNTSKILYHGTLRENLKNILSEGIKPMKRKYVHLSVNIEDAYEVAKRHGRDTVILIIDCNCLRKHNIPVYIASSRVRLVKYVPPTCIIGVKNNR